MRFFVAVTADVIWRMYEENEFAKRGWREEDRGGGFAAEQQSTGHRAAKHRTRRTAKHGAQSSKARDTEQQSRGHRAQGTGHGEEGDFGAECLAVWGKWLIFAA